MNIFYVIIGVLGLGIFIISLINLIKCIKSLRNITKSKNQFTLPTSIYRFVIKTYKEALKLYIISIILSSIPIGLLVSHIIELI